MRADETGSAGDQDSSVFLFSSDFSCCLSASCNTRDARGRTARRSVRSLPGEHNLRGAGQDMKVQPRRPIANVITIQAHTIAISLPFPAGNLPQTGQARSDSAIQREVQPVGRYLLFHNWPWADQAHLSPQDVPELGKLVETCSPEKPAHAGNARVMPQLAIPLATPRAGLRLRPRRFAATRPR